jgi:23S rRNA A1618 N6-methylase RlmF
MNRRSFLTRLIAGTAAATVVGFELDPERALWTPGKKTFFLPSLTDITEYEVTICNGPVYESRNVFLTPDFITKESLRVLQNNLMMAKRFRRDYDFNDGKQWTMPTAGQGVNVLAPHRFVK